MLVACLNSRDDVTHRMSNDLKEPISAETRKEVMNATEAALHLLPDFDIKDRVTVVRGYLSLLTKFPQNRSYLEGFREGLSLLVEIAKEHKNNELAGRFRSILSTL